MANGFIGKAVDSKWIVGMTAKWSVAAGMLWSIALVFAILGIAADASGGTLGLEATSWLLLAIALFIAAISFYIGWAVGVYCKTTDSKSK